MANPLRLARTRIIRSAATGPEPCNTLAFLRCNVPGIDVPLVDDDIAHLLAGEGGDIVAQLTAPSAGLFLEHVLYPGDAWPRPVVAAVPVR